MFLKVAWNEGTLCLNRALKSCYNGRYPGLSIWYFAKASSSGEAVKNTGQECNA